LQRADRPGIFGKPNEPFVDDFGAGFGRYVAQEIDV